MIGRVALTGATGFVGGHLLAGLLERGASVRALVRRTRPWLPAPSPVLEILHGDIRDPATAARLVDGVEAVLHAAAVVAPWVPPGEDLYSTNVHGTNRLLAATTARGVPMVITGSAVALDPYPPPRIVRFLDTNRYLESKRAVLRSAAEARRRGGAVSTVLPSGIVGPADHRPTAIGRVITKAMAGRYPPVSFSGGLYLVDVREVAEAHLSALTAPPGDYTIPGEYWPLDRLYRSIGELTGRRIRQLRAPAPLVMAGAAALTAWSSVVTHRMPLITPAWVDSFARASARTYPEDGARLGVRHRPVARALADAVAWFDREAGRAVIA